MPKYQKAKPFDFVRTVKDLQTQVKQLSVRAPGVNGSWVDMSGSLPSAFTLATVCRYKYFTADNVVHVQFSLNSTATAGGSPYTLFTLPSQYWPAVEYDGCAPRIFNTTSTFVNTLLNTDFRVTTAGLVQLTAIPGTAINNYSGYYVVPLD